MRKTPVPRNRRLGLVCALHALRGQLRVGAMATVYRALARRSFAASLTIAREDQVARPIPAQKECRCGEWVLGPRASGWLAQSCGKHLGHRTARCSLRGNGSSCSARAHNLVGFHTEIGLGADQTEGDLDLARLGDPHLGTLLIGTHTWVNHLRGPQDVARGPPDGIPPHLSFCH